MKKTIPGLLSKTALALAFMTQTASAQSWQPVGTPGFSPSGSGVCNWQSILINNDNEVYVAFNDEGQGLSNGQGTVMKFDGTTWQSIGTPGFTPGFAHHSSFALGTGDTIYYAFADGTASGFSRASVMRYDGTSWTNIGTNITTGECQYSNIKVTSDGSVYFASIDNSFANGGVVVKKYAGGTTWNTVGPNPTVSTAGASYTSLTLDDNDTLYIAYQDKGEAPGKVRVKKFNGTDWVNVGTPIMSVTGAGAIPAMDVHIAFNNKDEVYVAYSHGFQGPPRSSVHKFDGTDWALVGPAQFASGPFETSLFNKLAFDSDGAPYLVYQHGGLGNKASVMKWDGVGWVNIGLPGFSPNVTAHNGIAIDGNNNPYVVYFDQGNGNKTTVMKYTVCEAPVITSVSASDTTVCSSDSVLLTVTGTLNGASTWQWYAGSCGSAIIGSGTNFYVTPEDTTTYYVRGMGECVISGGCASITINVIAPKPTITANGNLLTSSAASGNQWYVNSAPIAGATGQQHTATLNGWYYVTVTQGNCTSQSDSVLIEGNSITENILKHKVSLYPTPFDQKLNLNFDNATPGLNTWQLYITDNLGRVHYQQKGLKQNNALDLGHLSQGLYFLNITTQEGENVVFKIVRQ